MIVLFSGNASLQKPLPCELDFPGRLSSLPAALADTYSYAVSKLHLVFDLRECAGAVVREMDARERLWAEVVRAVRYTQYQS